MKTAADMPAAAIERRSTTWLAWSAIGALLATLALEARDVARGSVQSAPVIEVEATTRVIASVPLDDFAPTAPVAIAGPPARSVAAKPTAADERSLIGMDAADVRAALGEPDFVRRDGRAQMWRYGAGGCALTVFLHGEGDALAVEHVENRVRGRADASCGDRLIGEGARAGLPG